MMKHPLGAMILALGLVGSPAALAQTRAGATALESRLYAPCCYGGTLDVHESDLARDLRNEIEGRLASGETSDAIQADFVARYGERVLAARSDAPIRGMGLALAGVILAAAIGLGLVVRRWARTSITPVRAPPPRDELDDRLDAELADLD